MSQAQDLERHLPLPPHIFHILLSLLEGDRHGYAILGDISERTDGGMKLGTSTLYAALQRLVRDGFLEETDNPGADKAQGPPRKVFRITEEGRALAREEGLRIRKLSRVVAESRLFDALAPASPGKGTP